MDLVDKIIELTDLFDDNVVTTADKIPQPEPRKDVLDREAINRFMRDNPPGMADGGRIGLKNGFDYRPGAPMDPLDPQRKISEVMDAYDRYYKGPGKKIRKIPFRKFFEIYAKENFADGGAAGGGMLVEPGFGGTRQGYKEKNLDRAAYKQIRPITQANIDNYAFFTSKEAAKPYKFKVQLPGGTEVFKTKKEAQAAIDAAPITNRDYTEGLIDFKVPKGATNFDKGRVKIPTDEFVGEGRDKSQIFKIQNKDGSNVKYTASGAGGGKKKLYNSIEEVKEAKLKSLPDELVKVSSKTIKEGIREVTYKNKKTGKVVKYYKPRVGEAKETIPGKGTTSLKEAEKFIKDYYVRNPKPVRDPTKDYASKDVRKKSLQETDPTKAAGTSKYNYHHIRQIAGGVPLTTDDVMIINQRINSALGTKYNQPLNAISEAIRKNNRLALEAMNAKQEGLALDYMKRVDNLNAQAEKIVNSAIDELPKKYKGYVGFNQFTLPRDEYGLPISNEPMLIKKVGGVPVSKDAIDLTNLSLKDEAKFRKIVRQQAERGKVGKIDVKKMISDGPTLGANLGFLKGFGEAIKAAPTLAGGVALNTILGVDPTSAIDRASIAAETAFAPQLVKQAAKFGPVAERFFNLGLSPAMAARAARIASPIGIASLGLEGLYQGGKFAKKRIAELKAMSPEERAELRQKGEAFAFDPFQAAGGGIAKLAGDPSGAMLESMNPDSQGLRSLKKRVKTI